MLQDENAYKAAPWLLLLSDDSALADAVRHELGADSGVRCVADAAECRRAVSEAPDIILFDAAFQPVDVQAVRALTVAGGADIPIILLTTDSPDNGAFDAIKSGVENFVYKDRLRRLPAALWQARGNREQRREHARITNALRANDHLLHTAGRIAKVGGWSLNLADNILEWTAETKRIHEVDDDYVPTVEKAIGFYVPKAREIIRAAVEGAIRDGASWDKELQIVTAAGRTIWVRAQGEAVFEDGRVVGLIGVLQEITDQKTAEDRLIQQAALIDMAPDAIVLRDLNHRILFWSRGAEQLYGWSMNEAIGRDFRELPGLEHESLAEIDESVRETGEWQGELKRVLPGGDIMTLDCHWTFLRDPEGWPASILSIDTNVTERKRLEAQFLRAQRMESIGTLAGGIAHDLNNILAPILMAGDLLRQHVQSESGLRLLDNLGRSARRGAELVRQVLSFARGVDGQRVPVQVRHIIREVEDMVGNTFPKNIQLEADVPKDLRLVIGDPTQINQILVNLCVNARDAMPSGGCLSLLARNVELDAPFLAMHGNLPEGRYVMVSVADDGLGMSPRVLEHIFEPFFTTKEAGKGTGLGLSTVQAILRSHDGFVDVVSEPGKGTVFKIYFPASEESEPVADDPLHLESIPRGNGELILLVDDEPSILNVTRQTLLNFGYNVVTAEDGASAVCIYVQRGREIDLVLTDMMMPILDGAAVINEVRRLDPKARIIASSGLTSNSETTRAALATVKHYLHKPYSARAMLRMVSEALNDRHPAGPAAS